MPALHVVHAPPLYSSRLPRQHPRPAHCAHCNHTNLDLLCLQVKGLSSQLVKALLFNCNPLKQAAAGAGTSVAAAPAAAPAAAGGDVADAAGAEAPMES